MKLITKAAPTQARRVTVSSVARWTVVAPMAWPYAMPGDTVVFDTDADTVHTAWTDETGRRQKSAPLALSCLDWRTLLHSDAIQPNTERDLWRVYLRVRRAVGLRSLTTPRPAA